MSALRQWHAAVRTALRGSHVGSDVRIVVDESNTTVRLLGPAGTVAVCTIARAAPAPRDARQLTIEQAIAARTQATQEPPHPTPEPSADPSPGPGDDGRGEDGREYPDGRPYAELRLIRSDWQRYRRALGDVQGGAHHGDWMPDGDHRTLTVSRPQYDAIRATIQEHPGLWERVEVALLADDATAPAPAAQPPEEPAKAPLYFSFQPHPAADVLASERGRSLVFVYADGRASVEARAGEESVFFREYWSGACGWDSRDMKPEKPTKAKKGGRS